VGVRLQAVLFQPEQRQSGACAERNRERQSALLPGCLRDLSKSADSARIFLCAARRFPPGRAVSVVAEGMVEGGGAGLASMIRSKGFRMSLKKISSSTVALLAAGVLVLAVGIYTQNGGFQLAGGLMLVVAAIRAIGQSINRSSGDR
jgi:hypothetical protein